MWTEILSFVGIPVLRNVAGWLENSFKDKKIDKYEWEQLFQTIFRVGVLSLGAYFGLNGMGVEIPAIGAGGLAVALDYLLSALKKQGAK